MATILEFKKPKEEKFWAEDCGWTKEEWEFEEDRCARELAKQGLRRTE